MVETTGLLLRRAEDSDFLRLRDEWNGLLGRSACNSPFLRWEWMHTWWRLRGQRHSAFILVIRECSGRLVGIAPFCIERGGALAPRTLCFCSRELSPDYLDVIAEKGLEAGVMAEVVRYLERHSREWDVLSLEDMRADAVLLSNPAFGSLPHVVRETHECPYTVIGGSFDDFMAGRTELAKLHLEKKMKQLMAKEGMRYVVITGGKAALAKGLSDIFHLHKLRFGTKGVESNFAPMQEYHEELCGLFAEEGLVRLALLYQGDRPVGGDYMFTCAGKIYFYQGGFDPAYKKWSVGHVLFYLQLKEAFEGRALEWDFLKGNEGYKYLWSNEVRRESSLTGYSLTARGALWRAKDGVVGAMRAAKRRLQPGGAGGVAA